MGDANRAAYAFNNGQYLASAGHVLMGVANLAMVGELATGIGNTVRNAVVRESVVGETSSRASIQVNREAGNAFRDELAAALRAEGRTVRTEVYKWTPFGKRYIDIDVRLNGFKLGGIETKVGSSRYLPSQRAKDWWLEKIEGYKVNVARKY